MFIRPCGNEVSHPSHTYTKHWTRDDVADIMPDYYEPKLPREWDSEYKCNGVNSWKIEQLHQDCKDCEDCAESAILIARATGSVSGRCHVEGKRTTTGDYFREAPIAHSATAVRG